MQKRNIAVIGLGYVGLPVAIAFGKQGKTIGFDINSQRVGRLQQGFDDTNEISSADIKAADIIFTTDETILPQADFHIVAVPTPVDNVNQPDLTPLYAATNTVAKILKAGDIVVYESTVFPGATEEQCVPILESVSGLKCGKDFFVGYSPERINPGDTDHTFENITKVVSGCNAKVGEIIADTYRQVVTAGVHLAPSIKVAEAAKVIENTQRDLNIALVNELSLIFAKMGIDTNQVLQAAATKWNFLPFKPGLVGGHCIGVDPYYLTYKAKQLGYRPEVILAGRRINDSMGKYVAEQTIKNMIHLGTSIKNARVAILGLSFKENCPDIRNTKVVDVINELKSYEIEVLVHDPLVEPQQAKSIYNVDLLQWSDIKAVDAIILAVAHQQFVDMPITNFADKFKSNKLVIDVKAVVNPEQAAENNITLWRL